MKLKRIHINQHHIRWNRKNPLEVPKPVMSVKCGGKTYTGKTVNISGPSKVIYKPNKPLACGARVWIETNSEVTIDSIIL